MDGVGWRIRTDRRPEKDGFRARVSLPCGRVIASAFSKDKEWATKLALAQALELALARLAPDWAAEIEITDTDSDEDNERALDALTRLIKKSK